jgi:hypothetical protein
MSLFNLIEAFNESTSSKIELRPFRDGTVAAVLPRTGQEILVQGSMSRPHVRVRERDIAALCDEVRHAVKPGIALIHGALDSLGEIAAEGDENERR